MKQIFTLLIVAGALVSCKNNNSSLDAKSSMTELMKTTEAAAFEKWQQEKYQEEMAEFQDWKEEKAAKEAKAVAPVQTKVVYVSQPNYQPVAYNTPTIIPEKIEPVEPKKKGWTNAAKGAAIGAGAGAIAGAVIAKKNRPLGALIGVVAGGGAGFGVGKILDKKKNQ